MAGHVGKAYPGTMVYDLSAASVDQVCAKHSGCEAAPSLNSVAGCDAIFTSLPRSTDVDAVAEQLMATGQMKPGATWVDTTSGVPNISKEIHRKLQEQCGVMFLDCGVAGGPAGAENGALSAMVGGADGAFALAQDGIASFCNDAKIVHIGPPGSGHAVKAVNNTMLAANIVTAAEGLTVLAKLGVDLDKALAAINSSSGASLVTSERIPNHVLTGEFDFGFATDLMLKDISICMASLDALGIEATTLRTVNAAFEEANATLGPKSEHMEVIRLFEKQAGAVIRRATPAVHGEAMVAPQVRMDEHGAVDPVQVPVRQQMGASAV